MHPSPPWQTWHLPSHSAVCNPCRSSSASCSFSSSPPPLKSPFRGHSGASHTQRWPGSWLCADHSPSEERGLWRPGHQEEGEAGSCHTRASPPPAHSWSQWQMLTHGCASGNCGTCPYLIRECAPGGGAVPFLTWVSEEGSTNRPHRGKCRDRANRQQGWRSCQKGERTGGRRRQSTKGGQLLLPEREPQSQRGGEGEGAVTGKWGCLC